MNVEPRQRKQSAPPRPARRRPRPGMPPARTRDRGLTDHDRDPCQLKCRRRHRRSRRAVLTWTQLRDERARGSGERLLALARSLERSYARSSEPPEKLIQPRVSQRVRRSIASISRSGSRSSASRSATSAIRAGRSMCPVVLRNGRARDRPGWAAVGRGGRSPTVGAPAQYLAFEGRDRDMFLAGRPPPCIRVAGA